MKNLLIFLLALMACGPNHEMQVLELEIATSKKGIRVYDGKGVYLGKSPVTLKKEVVIHHVGEGFIRYYIDGQEVHPGENWELMLEIFSEGVRTPVTVRVPFDPKDVKKRIEVEP